MKKRTILDIYLLTLIALGASAIALRTHSCVNFFNADTMHFTDKTVINIATAIIITALAAFVSYYRVGEKQMRLVAKNDNAATYIPSGIICIALMFTAVEKFEFAAKGVFDKTEKALPIVANLVAIFALLSVAAFFVSIFIQKRENVYKAAFSLSIVIYLALYAAYLYFNKQTHPTNSPNKIVDQMAYLFSAIFFLFETRIALGRAKWRLYIISGMCAGLLTAYSAIPALIVYFKDGYMLSDSVAESAVTLAIFIFIFSRVAQTRVLTPDVECEAAINISKLSSMRENEIEESKKLSRAQENNNVETDTVDAANYTFDIPYDDGKQNYNPDEYNTDI